MFKPLPYCSLRPMRRLVFVSSVKRASLSSWGLLFLAAQVFWTVTAPPVLAQDTSKSPLVVMGDKSYPPYEFLVDGEPVGINVDLWREISKTLGRPLDLRLYQWADAQARVRRGEAKVLTFMSVNKERAKLYDFTRPTFTSRYTMFVHTEIVDKFDVSDLTSKRIAVQKGGFPHTIIEAIHPEADKVLLDSALEGFRMLLRGEVDGFVGDERVGYTILRENKLRGITATSKALAVKVGHIAVVKGNPALLRQIDEALEAVKASGKFDQILNKWASLDTVLVTRETISFVIVSGLAAIVLILSLGAVVYFIRMRTTNLALRKEITERKRAEEALRRAHDELELRVEERTAELRESEARLAEAQRIAKLGYWVWDIETDQIHRSDAIFDIFGRTSRTMGTSYDDFVRCIHPDDRELVQSAVDQALNEKKPYSIEYRTRLLNKQVRYVVEFGEARFDEAGKPTRLIGAVLDITERRRAEEAFRESEEQLRLITDSVPGNIVYVDADQRYRFVNQRYEEWNAVSREEIVGKHVKDVRGELLYRDIAPYLEEVLSGREVSFEAVRRFNDGKTRHYQSDLIPHFGDDGKVQGYVALAMDITERKRAEELLRESEHQLREAQKMEAVGRLTGGVAHDFNNLLQAITGNLELLQLRLKADKRAHVLIEDALGGAWRGAELTQRLLAFARKQTLEPTVIPVSKLTRSIHQYSRL